MYAQSVILIRPRHFGFNAETAASNSFQHITGVEDVQQKAGIEFDELVKHLQQAKIAVKVFEDGDEPLPDAVFPNNWFSTHADGTLIVYPMLSGLRRRERREDVLQWLQQNFVVKQIIDLSNREALGQFLEGTGSMVFDHGNKMIYAALSPRTSSILVKDVARVLDYSHYCFCTQHDIYHTNVLMNVCEDFAVLCSECITDKREEVVQSLLQNGRELIDISTAQMESFAGNMLCLQNSEGERVLLLSETAFESLSEVQVEQLTQYARLLPISIPTIETVGGGSVRCMLAENFLTPKTTA